MRIENFQKTFENNFEKIFERKFQVVCINYSILQTFINEHTKQLKNEIKWNKRSQTCHNFL